MEEYISPAKPAPVIEMPAREAAAAPAAVEPAATQPEAAVPPEAGAPAGAPEGAPSGGAAAEPAGAPGPDVLAVLQARLDERLAELSASFEAKIKYDAVKEKIIDELHREVQSHREDLLGKALRPLFMDLIAMHDDMGSILRHAATANGGDPALINMVENLRSFQSTVEDILMRNGVEVYSEAGDDFVTGRQRATKMISTAEPAQHMKVAERGRKGFAYGGRVLRPEMVTVYRCPGTPASG